MTTVNDSLLDSLKKLRPVQFREVISKAGVPAEYLPLNAPQVTQAIELLQYIKQQPNGETNLWEIINNVQNFSIKPDTPGYRLAGRTEHFTGRETMLEQLMADLQPGRIITLYGMRGIGKTALAAEAVWKLMYEKKLQQRFPDSIISHDFSDSQADNFTELLRKISKKYNMEQSDNLEQAAQQALADGCVLLVLDSVEKMDDFSKIKNLAGSSGILITSQHKKYTVDKEYDIAPLLQHEAMALLQKLAERQIDDLQAAEEICRLFGGWPLAIWLAGHYMSKNMENISEYLRQLKSTSPLDILAKPPSHVIVSDLLARTLEKTSPAAQQVLALIGSFALASISRDILDTVLAEISMTWLETLKHKFKPRPKLNLPEALGELIRCGLLTRHDDRRYHVIHSLVHIYVHETSPLPDKTFVQLIECYIIYVKTQTDKGLRGYECLHPELPHLLHLLRNSIQRKHRVWNAALKLAHVLRDYLYTRGFWSEWREVLELGLKMIQSSDDDFNKAMFLQNLEIACRRAGQVEESIQFGEEALMLYRKLGKFYNEGNMLNNLGTAYADAGYREKALEYYEKAHECYEQALYINPNTNDDIYQSKAANLGSLGTLYNYLGALDEAEEYYQQALAILQEHKNKQKEGDIRGNLGTIYSKLGKANTALTYYQEALAIDREIGYRPGEERDLFNLALVYDKLGQIEAAQDCLNESIRISKELNLPYLEDSRRLLEQIGKH